MADRQHQRTDSTIDSFVDRLVLLARYGAAGRGGLGEDFGHWFAFGICTVIVPACVVPQIYQMPGMKKPQCLSGVSCSRAGDGTRTRDNLLGRQTLYQLSYPRVPKRVGVRGLEPPTSASQTPRATRLRHTPSTPMAHASIGSFGAVRQTRSRDGSMTPNVLACYIALLSLPKFT